MSAELNDIVASWVDLRIKLDGVELVGFTGVSFGDKIEDEMVYGAGRHPIGRTRGRYVTEDGSLTVYEDTFVELVKRLGDGWGDKRFEIVEQITLPDGSISTTVVESCRFKGGPGGAESGTSAITRELPFSFMRIKRNGRYLIAQKR